MNSQSLLRMFVVLSTLLLLPFSAQSQSDKSDSESAELVLVQALMCEDIQGQVPQNPTTVFSIELRKAICFTSFDPVPSQTVIYHHWFHRDQPSARIKLSLKPPRWSTYSSIQLRVEDLGPWRVEIIDAQGQILQILRFSITE